jgi:hypothetical protein
MEAIIWVLLITFACIIILVLTLIAADNHAQKRDEREAAELKAWEDAKAEEAKQAQRVERAKRRLDAQATAAQSLIEEAVPQRARQPRT